MIAATPEAIELVRRIARLGVELKPDREGGRVLYRPADRLSDELAAQLAANKWAVMGYLESRLPVDAVLDPLPEHDRAELHERYLARAETDPDAAWYELGDELDRRLADLDRRLGDEPAPADWATPAGRLLATCPYPDLRRELGELYADAAVAMERQGMARADAEREAFGRLMFELIRRLAVAKLTREAA